MLKNITQEEIEFCETLYDPVATIECLFDDFDNLASFEENKFSHIRLGQLVLLSYEYLVDYNDDLTEKQNFRLKKRAGEVFVYGGRLFGKTLFVEKTDLCIDMFISDKQWCGFCSYDAIHIRGVLEDVISALENHPVLKILNVKVTRSPNYRLQLPTGYLLEGVNMNLAGKNPGSQFYQKHFTKLYIEEASLETEDIYRKRRDSVSENGCIYRIAGMTNFTKYSPCGKIFYDLKMRPHLVNLPQYVNPKWNEEEREKAAKDFGGEQSISYRIFVKGEVVEEGISVFDMERIRHTYEDEKQVKRFEINKKNIGNLKDILILERFKQTEKLFISSDVGESAPSEIVVHQFYNGKYKYTHNITLYNLTDKEQTIVFKYIIEIFKADFVALDTTDGTGRAIYRSLEEWLGKEAKNTLVWVSFNEKLNIDFARDENNNIIFADAKPTYKEEYVLEWSIKRLKDLFYGERLICPIDYRLDMQLNSVVSMQSGTRTIYECVCEENHLLQAFEVFAISEWNHEFSITKPTSTKKFAKSGV